MGEKKLKKAATIFKQKNASLAYLIGSYATGKVTPMSDIDFAVLFNKKVPKDKYFDLQIELMGDLSKVFKRDDVEVVILNTASPLMKFETINKGKLLLGSHRARVDFEVATRREFFDTEYIREVQFQSLKKRYGVG